MLDLTQAKQVLLDREAEPKLDLGNKDMLLLRMFCGMRTNKKFSPLKGQRSFPWSVLARERDGGQVDGGGLQRSQAPLPAAIDQTLAAARAAADAVP